MTEVLDHAWIDSYKGLLTVPRNIHEHLRVADGDTHKAMFLDSGFTVNPDLTPAVEQERVDSVDQDLAHLRDDIATHAEQQVVLVA